MSTKIVTVQQMVDFILSQEDAKEADFKDSNFESTGCGCPMIQYARANGFVPLDQYGVGWRGFNDKEQHVLQCEYFRFEPDHVFRMEMNLGDCSARRYTYKTLKAYVLSNRFKARLAIMGITGIDFSRGTPSWESQNPQGNEGTNPTTELS